MLMDKIKIVLLYVLLFFGGFWHIVGRYQDALELLATPILIFISLWIGYEVLVQNILPIDKSSSESSRLFKKYLAWFVVIVVVSIAIEIIGVKTGFIFGHYNYGSVLSPFIFTVPIAIGFAWFSMVISSTAISQRFVKNFNSQSFLTALVTASFMTFFDFFMEKAAVKLNYWTWESGTIPTQNYISWFVIGFIFALLGTKLGVFKTKLTKKAVHLYIAQLLYFLMVTFS